MAKTFKDEKKKNLGNKSVFLKGEKKKRFKKKNKRSVSQYSFVGGAI